MDANKPAGRLRAWLAAKQKIVIPASIAFLGALTGLFIFFAAVLPQASSPALLDTTNTGEEPFYVQVENRTVYSQQFFFRNEMRFVGIPMVLEAGSLGGISVRYTLYGRATGDAFYTGKLENIRLDEAGVLILPLGAPVDTKGAMVLNFTFTGVKEDGNNALLAVDLDAPIRMQADWDTLEAGLPISTYDTSEFVVPLYWALFGLLLLLLEGLWFFIFVQRAPAQRVFVFAAILLGVAYMFVCLPYEYPDAVVHTKKTFYYSDTLLGAEHHTKKGELVWQRRAADDMEGFTEHAHPKRENYRHVLTNFLETDPTPGKTVEDTVADIGFAYQYLPGILGVTAARLLGLGQVPTLYLGGLFSLAAYIAIVYAAIRLTPFKTLFCLIGLTPHFLQIAGGFSYDVPINALAILFVALVLHLRYTAQRVRLWQGLLLLGIAALLVPMKLVYSPLVLLVLMIPFERWAGKPWRDVSVKAKVVAAACLAVAVGVLVAIALPFLRSQWLAVFGEPTRLVWGGEAYTFNLLIANPMEFFRLVTATAADMAGKLLTAGGDIFVFPLPLWVMCAVAVLYAISGFPVLGEEPAYVVTKKVKLLLAGVSLAAYLLVIAACLNWTGVGAYYTGSLNGPQSRYYLPMYPILALLPYGALIRKKNNDRVLLFAMGLLSTYAVLYLLQSGIFY